jgi:prepilin-type N-terminal cleavage/methylation domain-containing protein
MKPNIGEPMILRNEKGMSLVEILVAVALIGIALPMIGAIFLYGLQDYVTGMKYIQQQTQINSVYMTFRTDYEKAREIKLILDESLEDDLLNRIQAIEMIYDPKEAILDYTDEYKRLYITADKFYEEKSKPPYDRVDKNEIKKQIYEEKFYKRWEFVSDPNDPDTFSLSLSTSPGGILSPILENNIYKKEGDYQTGIFFNASEKKLWIRILPKPVNENMFTSRNVNEPVEWHFDFAYKDFEFVN